eukprot:g514.t1
MEEYRPRTRKRGRVQRYKFNAKQGRQVRPRLLLFSASQSTDGYNEMLTHCSFENGSAKDFGAFAVKLRDTRDIHHVQALFVNKDDQVVPANYPAVARTITEKIFPSKFKPEELSNLSSDINSSLSAWVQDLWLSNYFFGLFRNLSQLLITMSYNFFLIFRKHHRWTGH